MKTREEHLAWCKQRALEYVDSGDMANAFASMLSDLGKHPDTFSSVNIMSLGLSAVTSGSAHEMRKFIEGFS